MTTGKVADPFPADDRYWPSGLAPRPSMPSEALDLLASSIAGGATVIGIGPFTNFALLERARPGSLDRARVFVMGGWTEPPAPGYPQWGPEMDFNVQWDTTAAEALASHADLALCTLPAAMKAHLRAADLPRLRASGPLGELLAGQSEAFAREEGTAVSGSGTRRCPMTF